MLDLLQMLCALPAPCGDEGIAKKYITMKYPDFKEDAFGNLVYRNNGEGELIMLYASLDEDAVLAMEIKDEKVYFAHIGSRKIYPSMAVSFGGYTGILCEQGETKYLHMTDKGEGIEQGRSGVFDGEFEGETDKDENLLLGKNIANRAAVAALLTAENTNKNICVVLGVKSNHTTTGLEGAISALKPDKIIILEETKKDKFAIKMLGEGFGASEQAAEKLASVLEKADVAFERTADNTEKTMGAKSSWVNTAVLGIPALFTEFIRQGIRVKTAKDLSKIVNTILEDGNE